MKPSFRGLLDPTVFTCFSSSYFSSICSQLKWSTVSITTALIIIIVYATSGLYTLIDVTTLISTNPVDNANDTWALHLDSSSSSIQLRWISLAVYFSVVLLVFILLCGIRFGQPWILFVWSILMIIMLLADGIVTVFSLRHSHDHFHRGGLQRTRILFCVLLIRLTVALFGIFLTIFHFRGLTRAKSEYRDRQRMLDRYNAESASPSFDQSWSRPGGFLIPSKEMNDDHFIPDVPEPVTLPRAKIATIQRHPTSTMFHARRSSSPHVPSSTERPPPRLIRPVTDYNEAFQYNIPLQERFYHEKILNEQEL